MSASARHSEPEAARPRFRPLRWLAALLGLLVGLPVLLAAVLLVAGNTEPGRAALAGLAERLVPGLRIQGLKGPLPGEPGFARLTMADEHGVWLEVEGARLAWDPLALLRGEARIEALTADRIALHRLPASAPPAEPQPPGPLIPQLPDLPVALRLERLAIGRIELDSSVLGQAVALRADGTAQLDPTGLRASLDIAALEGGTSLDLDAALRPATGRLSARAKLRGKAGGPLSALAGLGERPLSLDLVLDGPAERAALTLRAEAGTGVSAELAGAITAPNSERLALAVEGRVDGSGLLAPPLAGLAGPVEVRLDAGRMPDGLVDLRTLRLSGAAGVVQADGRIDTAADRTALELHASLAPSEAFAGLLPAETAGWDALEAQASVTGRLSAPHLALQLAPAGFRTSAEPLAALLGPTPRVTLRASAPDRIELLTVTGQAIGAEARGSVGDPLDLTFSAAIEAPGAAVPGLSGALQLQGSARGARSDPTLALTVKSDRLEASGLTVEALALEARIAHPATRPEVEAQGTGTLQELPLSISLRGTPGDGGWLVLQNAEAALGPARLTAAGRLNPSERLADGEARLEAADLAPLSRLAGQPLSGMIRLEAGGAPRDGQQTLSARLDVPRLAAAGVTARDVKATAEGSLAALDLTASGVVGAVEAETRAKLSEGEGGARQLDIAALRATSFGETVRLAQPARVTLRPDGAVELGATTIALPRSGTLRAEGRWGPERADLRATLAGLNLAAFSALAPDLNPIGTVTGEARVTGPTSAPELVANLRGSGLRAAIPAARGLPPGELRLDLRRAGGGLVTAEAEARLGPQQRLAATARFPRGPGAEAPFEATLDGSLDIGQLSAPLLAAGADRVAGRLALALRASGTPAAPDLGGEARLSGGSYRNPLQGVSLTDIAGTLRPDGPRLRADITGRTPGDGRIALAGTIEPFTRYLPLDLVLTATEAQPISSDLLRATLDAELRLSGLLGEQATLSGPVRVRRAEIRVPEKLGSQVRTLGPVIERGTPPGGRQRPAAQTASSGGEAPREAAGPPIALAIQVEAPRNVFVRGRGLDAELGGELRIGGRIAAPEITGELDLRRGDVTIIGRRITFDRGRLIWDGTLLPDLDFRASSQAGQTTVRVEVTGPATSPEIAFSSTPELPQDEVLARLLFDRPLRDLSPIEIGQLAAAVAGATGLPGGGATGVVDRLRQGLGLDRLSVGGRSETASRETSREDRAGATVEAGRYVADGVYVGVKQGTEPGSSRVGVRVDLTPRMKLEAETGDREAGSRVGLSWEWQWGR